MATEGLVVGIDSGHYVPNRRNKHGEPFGFVKFSNVRDVTKLTTALKVASFARNNTTTGRRLGAEPLGNKKEGGGLVLRDGNNIIQGSSLVKGVVERREIIKRKAKQGEDVGIGPDKGVPPEDLRVVEIVVKLEVRKKRMEKTKGHMIEGGSHPKGPSEPEVIGKKEDHHFFCESTKPSLMISGGDDVLVVFNNSKEFFILIFLHWKRWDFNAQPYKRGAWVCLYRIPVHAWNVIFFKFCGFVCGSFLCVYSCSADKDRLDFARVEVKVVEEWGYALGEDTCLFDDESDEEASQMVDGLEEEEDTRFQANMKVINSRADDEVRSLEEDLVTPTPAGEAVVTCPDLVLNHLVGSADYVSGIRGSLLVSGDQGSILICSPTVGLRRPIGEKGEEVLRPSTLRNSRTKSGPWSLDWLQDRNQGDAGVARLPSKDRSEVLKILKKTERRRKVGPGTNQSKEVVEDDVREVEKAIRVTFNGDNENMFSVLARAGKGPGGRRRGRRFGSWLRIRILLCCVFKRLKCNLVTRLFAHLFGTHKFVLCCHGRFIKSSEEFSVTNVYAPCEPGAKQQLSIEEHRSDCGRPQSLDHLSFNHFIEDNNLIDLPLSGRKFIWFKGDALWMSRLDRFLLSREWCLTWPDCTQVARMRGLSDHFPLILAANEVDWGPRPSRMLKCWKNVHGYNIFVKDNWNSYQVDGWGEFVLKEMIKMALKDWHKTHTQNLPSRIESLQDRVAVLDASSCLSLCVSLQAVNVVRLGVDSLTFEVGSLIKPFSSEEVKAAVWDCDSYKSPGADGVNFGFIKDSWNEMQGDVMRLITEFHRNGRLTKGVNATFIALIPKVLANQLRLVMGSVISESQTAFVRDRKILDGILIANEVVDEARRAKKELMLFKVDFEKAYDSVDWGYLDVVMGRMGFPTVWRKWIKECVCTATASVLVIGSPTDEFLLERGLRQWDPLSPYMVGKSASILVSHLQFADETLLMGTKSWANVRALRAMLVLFETMSGLKVNFNKSMLVGVNIPDSWLGEATSALGCRTHSSDRWIWQPDLDCDYIVRGAYQLLTDRAVHVRISVASCQFLGWFGYGDSSEPQTLLDHFVQFTTSAGGT
ncbi:hypothetical protein TSUD_276840 [Trifolium subterraneum]|uniref:Reverse transcriptase domain-containing protein n=1 Tax=Trifolium subterraneum TaxID=3900 RepID=A0A2Z6NRZ9_TRISU|nr:hypothetical protein TSUD_276840 [Trifolium subterraneum]